jgi:signal transduction histidine kinase
MQGDSGTIIVWPIALTLLPMIGTLWLLERYRSWFYSVAYLLVGSASVYFFVLIGTTQFPGTVRTDEFVFSMAKMALMFVGGTGIGVLRIVGWSVAGFVLGEIVTVLAVQTRTPIALDTTTLSVFAVIVTTLGVVAFSRRRVSDAQPSLHRAARDEHLSDIRQRIEARAAAMMHDTVLNHLAAVGASDDGPLRADLRARIERDLEVLVGEEWLVDGEDTDERGETGWFESRLFRTLEEARDLGLDVVLSGDRTAVTRLDTAREAAVALAVKQCLVNVLKHAGTDRAEVVVYGSGSEVSVMVIDDGKGFVERETSVDRLGLRQSVRQRIEAVDGSVQVWSSPGMGTSVLLRLPVTEPDDAVEVTR